MKKIILISFIVCLILSTAPATATVPQLISIQGKLTDASDTPITANTAFDFYIYDDEFAGTQLWSETHTITPDSDGIFTALMGTVTALDLPFNESYWLRVDVGGETLSPRYPMTSVPYALNTLGGASKCEIFSIDTSCRVPTTTWNALFPSAVAAGYELKNCWPRKLPQATVNDRNTWLYSTCYTDPCISPNGNTRSNPSKTDTWASPTGTFCAGVTPFMRPYAMDITCCNITNGG